MPDQPACAYQTRPGSYWDETEFCEEEAAEGQPYCAEHGRLADG